MDGMHLPELMIFFFNLYSCSTIRGRGEISSICLPKVHIFEMWVIFKTIRVTKTEYQETQLTLLYKKKAENITTDELSEFLFVRKKMGVVVWCFCPEVLLHPEQKGPPHRSHGGCAQGFGTQVF